MICAKCGAENNDSSKFCQGCGMRLGDNTAQDDESTVGALGILFFLFPLVGWIMYFVWKNDKYYKAKKAASIAWAGFFIGFFINIILLMLGSMSH
jgi:uncharacterized membrane protein YvbJ